MISGEIGLQTQRIAEYLSRLLDQLRSEDIETSLCSKMVIAATPVVVAQEMKGQ